MLYLLAFGGFSGLSFAVDETSSFYLSVSLHPDLAMQEHPIIFLILSSALTCLAWAGAIPLNNIIICTIYCLLFAFISTKAMIGWAFPLSLASDSLKHDFFSFPFLYLYVSKFLLTFSALWNPVASSAASAVSALPAALVSAGRNGGRTHAISQAMFFCACVWPFMGVSWAATYHDQFLHSLCGISYSAVVGFSTLCLSTRATELTREVQALKAGLGRTAANACGNILSVGGQSLAMMCACVAVFWTCVTVLNNKAADSNLLVPLASLLFMCTKVGTVVADTPPLMVIAAFCCFWWSFLALNSIFLKGFSEDSSLMAAFDFHAEGGGLLGLEGDVSIWTNESLLWPMLNLALMCMPLPGIYLGIMRQKGDSEEMMFVLAITSAIPVIGAQIWSIRYLGLLGVVMSAWRCYDISRAQKRSDQLI